ncbi:uncharacterized protein LOC124139980 isoform X2 [Haliotis rufescens]|uniref:uncharacterized protein LOC124139980 isoform X2 n=1 Tax=Haliotis rufescens TaxID=6454 RepID=UPI00201F7167|nr:uncharacterized protein LOC124139980 isoform X2 [Haliotis rufescens]
MDHCEILLVYFALMICSSSVNVLALQCPSCHRVQNVNHCLERTETCSAFQDVCIGVLDEWHVTFGCGTMKRCEYDGLQDTTDCRGTHPFGPRDKCTVCCTGDICQSRMMHVQHGLDTVPGVIHCPVCHNEDDPQRCLDNVIPCEHHHRTCEIKNIDGKWSSRCSHNSSCLQPSNQYPPDCTQSAGSKECVFCCNDHTCLDYAFGIKHLPTPSATTTSVGGTSATLTFAPPSTCRDQSLFPCHRAVGEACTDPDISKDFCPLTCGFCRPRSTTVTTRHVSSPSSVTRGGPTTTVTTRHVSSPSSVTRGGPTTTERATNAPNTQTTHHLTKHATNAPNTQTTHHLTKHATHAPNKQTTHSSTKLTTYSPHKHSTDAPAMQTTHVPTRHATHPQTTQIHTKHTTHMATHHTSHTTVRKVPHTHQAMSHPGMTTSQTTTAPRSTTSLAFSTTHDIIPSGIGVGCPNGYTQYAQSCYMHRNQKMTFIKASEYCRQHHGYLTEIETATESAYVKAFLKGKIIDDGVWLGANDIRFEGYYVWDKSENPLNYTDWYPGEPNQKTVEEDCMSSWKVEGYQWADHYCDRPDLEPFCETEVTKCS